MNNRVKGISMAVLAASLWGLMSIFVRNLTAAGYSSGDISFLRCLLAGTVFFALIAATNPRALRVDAKGLVICLLYGAVAYSMSFLSYSIAVARIPVAVATVLTFMSPIWVCLLSRIVFRERVRPRKLASIAVCLIGAVLAANLLGVGGSAMDPIGIIAAILNGAGVALQIMIPRYFAGRYSRDTMLVYGFFGASLFLSFFANYPVIGNSLRTSGAGIVIGSIFGIGILCTMIANVCFVKSANYVEATTTSILAALEVVVGCVVGFLVFHENLTVLQVVGAVIIVAGSLGSELLGDRPPEKEPQNETTPTQKEIVG